jgi:hypothetical protein
MRSGTCDRNASRRDFGQRRSMLRRTLGMRTGEHPPETKPPRGRTYVRWYAMHAGSCVPHHLIDHLVALTMMSTIGPTYRSFDESGSCI